MVNPIDVEFISDLEFLSHSQQELLFQTDTSTLNRSRLRVL